MMDSEPWDGSTRTLSVNPSHAGVRADHFVLAALTGSTRSQVARLFADGWVRVNGRLARKGQLLCEGDLVRFPAGLAAREAAPDPDLPLAIVHEDRHLVVVDKAAGVPSHALRAGERGTVASALLARYPEMADVGRHPREAGLVHRLDTDTSGLLLAARDRQTFAALVAALSAGELDKRYIALAAGQASPGLQRAFLDARGRRVRVFDGPRTRACRPIATEVLDSVPCGDHCRVELRASRASRHQVRAHLAFLGHPLYGDLDYGGEPVSDGGGHSLHALSLVLRHPATGVQLALQVPPPPAFVARHSLLLVRNRP